MRYMKLIFVFLLLAVLTGCSTQVLDKGVQIQGKRKVDIRVHNNSTESIFLDVQMADFDFRRNYHLVKSGAVHTFTDMGDWDLTITVRHYDPSATDFIGESLQEFSFKAGAFEDSDIYIDALTLIGKSQRHGYMTNMGDPARIEMDDGRSFALKTGDSVVFGRTSGPIMITVSPLHDPYNTYGARTVRGHIYNTRNNFEYHPPDGGPMQLLDFRILVNEHWRTR